MAFSPLRSFCCLICVILLSFSWTIGQSVPAAFDMPLPKVQSYDSKIPTPDQVIGHVVGESHTEPHLLVEYTKAIAAASDRVLYKEHGRTFENRPLVHAIISSPSNLSNLDSIKAAHQSLSDNPESVSDADLENMPAVVLLGYSIHGNEATGSEAALLGLYHLAASQGQFIDDLLENTVIILDPCFNPDGRARFTGWVNRNRGAVPNTDNLDREHNEAWPGGRTNHYWFDLNRDWLPAQLPESQARLTVFHDWRPVLLTDHHEMGSNSSFFFMPGIPSRNNPNTDKRNYELTGMVAEFHAQRLDAIGALYYSSESFDDFYYGKGSTFPDINGAVGILFEQASSRALKRTTSSGELTYSYGIRNQFSTTLSTLDAVHEHRVELLKGHRDFYSKASRMSEAVGSESYLFNIENDRGKGRAFIELLQRHDIEVNRLNSDFETSNGEKFSKDYTFAIPSSQRQHRLLKIMMDRVTEFPDSLFYDVSTWTLPLAFGLDYITSPSLDLGPSLHLDDFARGEVQGTASDYGYLMPWGDYFAPKVLSSLQNRAVYPRLIRDPFTASIDGEEMSFEEGALFIPLKPRGGGDTLRPDEMYNFLKGLADRDGAKFYSLDSGYTSSGPDMGSGRATILHQRKIAVLTGDGTSAYRAGEVWHLLNQRFEIPTSLVDIESVSSEAISKYNVIVMPGGSYTGLDPEVISAWVNAGGTLVATTSGSSWAVRNGFAHLDPITSSMDSLLIGRPFGELSTARGAQGIGGAIFESQLDTSHPLALGFPEKLAVFRQGTNFFAPSNKAGVNLAVYDKSPLLSGYVSEEVLEQMAGASSVFADRMGRGKTVLFFDNPNFRAFWYGTNGLFLNAIFLSEAF